MPLVRSWWLSKKKGKEAWVGRSSSRPGHPSGKRVEFEIEHAGASHGRAEQNMARCAVRLLWSATATIASSQVRDELDVERKPEDRLMAIVAEGNRRRVYVCAPDASITPLPSPQTTTPSVIRDRDDALRPTPRGTLVETLRLAVWVLGPLHEPPARGLTTFSDLVTRPRARAR